jgi:CheY-like chemotaxis protein
MNARLDPAVAMPAAAPPRPAQKPLLLCVDDEPLVLEGLALVLRRHFEVVNATSGEQALALLGSARQPAVILSDMRMPGMNGAAFLAAARERAPDAVRMLLTGQADMASAISAVNDGQIFRFLTKPCAPPTLLAAVEAAAEQNRLITAERELLEQTLVGSIKALTDILSIASPLLFGRALRVRRLVHELAQAAGTAPSWQMDAACMLSQIGTVALPPTVANKVARGHPLDAREDQMVDNARALSVRLVANIPRLEEVIALMEGAGRPWSRQTHASVDPNPRLARDAQLLRAVTAFDMLEAVGEPPAKAIATLRAAVGEYDGLALDALQALRASAAVRPVRACRLVDLEPGMTLAEDVRLENGVLLISRGYEITEGLLERLDNFGDALAATEFKVYASL